jgi:hypothetical protein
MDENTASAQLLLAQAAQRRKIIDGIRKPGLGKYVGQVLGAGIILAPLFMKVSPTWNTLGVVFGALTMISWEQRDTQKRFDALVDFLESEGVIKK